MTILPEKFKIRMKEQLGAEYDSFLACYERESKTGIRVNTGRISPERLKEAVPFSLQPIPWTEKGFYYDKADPVTKHPYYYAGLYYVQEPSAMLPASRLPIEEGDIVLDLCAAPGGKATELASRLAGTGLLVANDVSASRAKALVKNLTVWGCQNCCITAETPEKLLEAFGCFFDKILVDAPCSGEGMFRRDSGLIGSWEERGPEAYAVLQKQILDSALRMLKPGGMLLYSTCTFAPEEDEHVIAWALDQFPELELVQAETAEGLVPGYPPCEKALRVWPHRTEGEGHFLALLHKRAAEGSVESVRSTGCGGSAAAELKTETAASECGDFSRKKTRSAGKPRGGRSQEHTDGGRNERSGSRMPEEVRSFLEQIPERLWRDKMWKQIDDQCFLLPEGIALPRQLRYLRTGLMIGTLKKERFEPSQPLAMILDRDSFPNVLDLPSGDERVLRYLKGETIDLKPDESAEKGWILVCTDGYALGWGKTAGGSIKNKYYQGWRLQ